MKDFLVCCVVVAGLISCQKDGQQNSQPVGSMSETKPVLNDKVQVVSKPAVGGNRLCGSEFSGLSFAGKTFSDVVSTAGAWHNEYLENIFTGFVKNDLKPSSPGFKDFLHRQTKEIFSAKGIPANDLPISKDYNFLSPPVKISKTGYSAEGYTILTRLFDLIDSKCETGDESVANDLDELQKRALSLDDQKESLSVGIAVSVAKNSNNYWKANAGKWFDYTGRLVSARKLGVGQLVKADAVGAVEGALYGGIGAGPAGAVAGAILVSSTASLLNCFSQAVGWLVSWW